MPEGNLFTSFDPPTEADLRLSVLEMTVAAIVAQLPPPAMQEIVSLLVFVAKGAEAVAAAGASSGPEGSLDGPSAHATRMLERIAKARRGVRPPGPNPGESGGAV